MILPEIIRPTGIDKLINSGLIQTANADAVKLCIYGGSFRITNSGTIETGGAGANAIATYGGNDVVLNMGQLIGNVELGDGANSFDGRLGTTDGTVYGQGGNDRLYGSKTADDVLDGGTGADYLNGGGGEDSASYADAAASVRADLAGQSANLGDAAGDLFVSIEDLTGSSYDDTLYGDGNDFLYGGGGNDALSGGTGQDYLAGGIGDDSYTVDDTGDWVVENVGEGTDTVNASISYTLTDNVENLTLTGTANINGTGNALANTITGNGGNNVLDGGMGADRLSGGNGDDTYYVDNTADVVLEGSATGGNDQIFSSVSYSLSGRYVEKMTLTGTGDINATGNNNINTLIGNSGANILDGSGGSDTLTGGGGADFFLFDSALGSSNIDTITDLTVGTDLITLDRSIFAAAGADGPLSTGAFGLGTTATTTAQRILYDSATGDIYYDKDGTGASAAVKFAHVAAGLALTANAFTIQG